MGARARAHDALNEPDPTLGTLSLTFQQVRSTKGTNRIAGRLSKWLPCRCRFLFSLKIAQAKQKRRATDIRQLRYRLYSTTDGLA